MCPIHVFPFTILNKFSGVLNEQMVNIWGYEFFAGIGEF